MDSDPVAILLADYDPLDTYPTTKVDDEGTATVVLKIRRL